MEMFHQILNSHPYPFPFHQILFIDSEKSSLSFSNGIYFFIKHCLLIALSFPNGIDISSNTVYWKRKVIPLLSKWNRLFHQILFIDSEKSSLSFPNRIDFSSNTVYWKRKVIPLLSKWNTLFHQILFIDSEKSSLSFQVSFHQLFIDSE